MRKPAKTLANFKPRRDFGNSEPAGKQSHRRCDNLFIMQKRDAKRLYWDLRLEVDGVLNNWAVTKAPAPDPEVKRLAVRTKDHPQSCAEFERAMPKNEYDSGTILVWDHGT